MRQVMAWGCDALVLAAAAKEVLLAHKPALPMSMIAKAVAVVVPDATGRAATPTRLQQGDKVSG